MARDNSRARRVAEQLQRELAQLLQQEIKDPRVGGMVTITSVGVTQELEQATVYVTVLEDDPNTVKQTIKVLNGATGFLRREIAQRLRLRHVPQLKFKFDASVETGARLSALINAARAADAQRKPDESEG